MKELVAGVGGRLVTERTRSAVAKGRSNTFARCIEGGLKRCEQQHTCRITERDGAASGSNAEW